MCLIPLWLSPLNRPARFGRGRKAGTRATPPKKQGGHAVPKRGALWHTLFGPHDGSLSSSFIPAGRLRTAPRSGAENTETEPMKWRELVPFPSPLDDPRSVLAVKGPLRRFAPWTAPGRSEGMAVYEGKGGMQISASYFTESVVTGLRVGQCAATAPRTHPRRTA